MVNPAQVSVGFNHACAQDDTDGACWGNIDKAKRTVPETLQYVKDNDSAGTDDAADSAIDSASLDSSVQ